MQTVCALQTLQTKSAGAISYRKNMQTSELQTTLGLTNQYIYPLNQPVSESQQEMIAISRREEVQTLTVAICWPDLEQAIYCNRSQHAAHRTGIPRAQYVPRLTMVIALAAQRLPGLSRHAAILGELTSLSWLATAKWVRHSPALHLLLPIYTSYSSDCCHCAKAS